MSNVSNKLTQLIKDAQKNKDGARYKSCKKDVIFHTVFEFISLRKVLQFKGPCHILNTFRKLIIDD
jgi:hypothetical protein